MGVPYSAATARNRLRNGEVPAPVRRAFFEATVARTHTLLSLARWVAPSSVGSRVARRHPPPHRCTASLDFPCGAEAREGRHLGALKVVFCSQAQARTRPLSSMWGDRVMTAQQKDIDSGWGLTEPQSRRRYPAVPAHPRQPTPRFLGKLLCDYLQSLSLVEFDQAGTGDSRWVHSRPVRCVAGAAGYPRRRSFGVGVQDDWGWSDPGTLLGVPSPPLSEGRPLLAVSGSSRRWPARVSSSHTWEARMWSAIAGAQGTGAAASPTPP